MWFVRDGFGARTVLSQSTDDGDSHSMQKPNKQWVFLGRARLARLHHMRTQCIEPHSILLCSPVMEHAKIPTDVTPSEFGGLIGELRVFVEFSWNACIGTVSIAESGCLWLYAHKTFAKLQQQIAYAAVSIRYLVRGAHRTLQFDPRHRCAGPLVMAIIGNYRVF